MNYKLFLSLVAFPVLIFGCASTPNYKSISEDDIPSYLSQVSDLSGGSYDSYWVQPINKKEKCEVLMEGYNFDGSPSNKIESESMLWDGECKKGKTHGLGKMLVNSGSVDWYEIAYHNMGVTDRHYYRGVVGNNNIKFGSYVRGDERSNGLLETQATINTLGEIEFIYAYVEIDSKDGISKGVINRKYNDGSTGKYTGVMGNKLFFGAREFFDSNNQATGGFWGYANLTTDKPESYIILKNKQGLWHQIYEFGGFKENVKLPQSYINTIMKVSDEAAKSARMAGNAGQIALAMKKKYDASNRSSEAVSTEENPKPERGVSTGTGFFVSNDGYLLTNSHVVNGAEEISIILNGEKIKAALIDQDDSNDIALLKVNKKITGLPLEFKNKTQQGEEIIVLGYPNIGLQGNNQKATFGYINARSGIKGDTRYFQISAPIQPGNSGSPMLNEKGVVIGIASASLNQSAMLDATGTLAQNVNYAVKIAYALPLLIGSSVSYSGAKNTSTLSKTDIVEKIKNSVVLVVSE